eukprot:11995900-Alexandrium_andersonii.AAC.1
MQLTQSELIGAVTNEASTLNIGAVMTPVFAYRKGFLWKAEHAMLESLANANINLDRSFALVFSGHADDRELRPASAG